MSNMHIDATERSPEILFDFTNNVFSIRGESYPEDVNEFYGRPIGALEDHLARLNGSTAISVNLEFVYFNSSTAKILMNLFELLDTTASQGNPVLITWTYENGDDNMEELGEEFGEDLEYASFTMNMVKTDGF